MTAQMTGAETHRSTKDSPRHWDVVVVGAGPGGSSCAAILARHGLRVALLERSAFPRDKVCGDFLSPRALAELRTLGCLDDVLALGSPPIHHATFFLDGRRVAGGDIPQVADWPAFGLAVPRQVLDILLARVAESSGAEMMESFQVEGVAREGRDLVVRGRRGGHAEEVRARLVVGADGARSAVARSLAWPEPRGALTMAAMRTYAEGLSLDGSVQLFEEEFFPGYAWAFPTTFDTANVGVGVVGNQIGDDKVSLRRYFGRLEHFLHAYARRRGLAPIRIGRPQGWPIHPYDPARPLVHDGVLLVGEAAGLVDPLNGEGIPHALESGRLAARVLHEAVTADDLSQERLLRYESACRERFDIDLRVSDLLVATIRNRHLAALWMGALEVFTGLAASSPAYARRAGGALAGVLPARDLLSPAMILETAVRGSLLLGVGAARRALRDPAEALSMMGGLIAGQARLVDSFLGDRSRVEEWAGEIAGKQRELARLLYGYAGRVP